MSHFTCVGYRKLKILYTQNHEVVLPDESNSMRIFLTRFGCMFTIQCTLCMVESYGDVNGLRLGEEGKNVRAIILLGL